ncbi:MAG: hypothetical protein QOJ19_3870 [Acidimicrobiia bacterium]|nr:hypothetical protein [Acidimicrobiia bacterium]
MANEGAPSPRAEDTPEVTRSPRSSSAPVEDEGTHAEDARGENAAAADAAAADPPAADPPAADTGDEDVRDELPEDLDVSGFVGPYVFPNNSRRRVPGALYLLMAAGLVAVWLLAEGSPLVNGGFLLAALLLAVAGAYSLLSGWNLAVDERDALVAATAEVGFAVGHASAQMGWRGLLSKPTWRILLYSAEDPPTKRALVLVDGIAGGIIDRIVEDNPEDWSDLFERSTTSD